MVLPSSGGRVALLPRGNVGASVVVDNKLGRCGKLTLGGPIDHLCSSFRRKFGGQFRSEYI